VINADAWMDFTEFVAERHRVWERRQSGQAGPWTEHPYLAAFKFTNVFRVIDYGSQFLLKELLDPDLDERNTLMRCFLYRHTGRVETWEYLDLTTGYPTIFNLEDVREALRTYRGRVNVTQRGQEARNNPGPKNTFERPLFTSAYLVFPQSSVPGTDKLDSIIDLTKRLFTPGSDDDVIPDFLAAKHQSQRFQALRRNKGVADFMSMQILTDWGYTVHCPEDREDEFVIPGPGAKRGAKALDPEATELVTLKWALEQVRQLDDCPRLPLPDGGVRLPSLMDVQNCFCEFSKLVRYQGKPAPARAYTPAHPGAQEAPTLPKQWSATS
jgi:hypothetical protein